MVLSWSVQSRNPPGSTTISKPADLSTYNMLRKTQAHHVLDFDKTLLHCHPKLWRMCVEAGRSKVTSLLKDIFQSKAFTHIVCLFGQTPVTLYPECSAWKGNSQLPRTLIAKRWIRSCRHTALTYTRSTATRCPEWNVYTSSIKLSRFRTHHAHNEIVGAWQCKPLQMTHDRPQQQTDWTLNILSHKT